MPRQEGRFPHTLVPLNLAVTLVRARLSDQASVRSMDPNALATFIASTVPVFEYTDDPKRMPRPLHSSLHEGLFRGGGRELRFLDGRPSKSLLAVHADDIACVVEMLRFPDRAALIRTRVLSHFAHTLVERSDHLTTRSSELRRVARRLMRRACAAFRPNLTSSG